MSEKILVVDDDPVQRRILGGLLGKMGFEAVEAAGGEAALSALSSAGGSEIRLVILDLVMPDLDGMGVLERMSARPERPPVIVQTAHGGIDTVVSAMRAGACDFIVKPVSPERLDVSVKNALNAATLDREIGRIKRQAKGRMSVRDILTLSPTMERVLELARKAAASNIPIILEGESGVGKELVARAIQGESARAARPFVPVNCGAIPENLVESTLFGHEKGAFTGATDKRIGKFAEADGGTLFLDEISELPLEAQVKLLRAIQEGEIEPVGARQPRRVDIRLISATNRDLADCVRAGRFREDLYYRLSVFPILIPPLRNRREDIPLLARHFMARFAAEEGKRVRAISPDAMLALQAHDWPGNVRQLENTIFRAVVLCEGDALTLDLFPQLGVTSSPQETPVSPADSQQPALPEAPAAADSVRIPPSPSIDASDPIRRWRISALAADGQVRSMQDIEADLLRIALERYDGRMSEVARRLGIGRSTLYRRIRDLGIDDAA
ncbi:MAG: sigma-54-dependent Fis family transcriptional regulator [Rhodobiaceae bacterium]|nr:sigma-54-dependent Fis family transcriptional regulator [Rhodobiaceae bacterium]MCC0040953.1 sigma-54-dependent Fis family transcriptional regulator [Rhodobiaceae bacterium]